MKRTLKNLTKEQFEEYCGDIETRMESETTYWGQIDEHIPYYEELRAKHIYGQEKNEHEIIFYIENYNEETGEIFYDIYEGVD